MISRLFAKLAVKALPRTVVTNSLKWRFSPSSRAYSVGTFADVMQTFYAVRSLHFANEEAFHNSPISQQLRGVLAGKYRLSPGQNPLQTLSMQETMQLLGLDITYRRYLDPNKYLLGVHGAGACSLPATMPRLVDVKQMATSHNPFHFNSSQVLFFYGNNVRMVLHYSHLNSVATEEINGESDPHYYADRVGIVGFVDKEVVDEINRESSQITVANTAAAVKHSYDKSPEDYLIGNEVRLPKIYHPAVFNLPLFSIKGARRLFPLDKGEQYVDGKRCSWKKGEGFIDNETGNAYSPQKKI